MNYMCFDIGGTFIKYGISDIDGNILYNNKIPTPQSNCRVSIPNNLIELINKHKTEYKIESVGISSAGQINSKTGTVVFAMDTIPEYTGCKLAEKISMATDFPTNIENDAKCATLGELWKGAGKNYNNFICLTLGTGVGGAIILNKKLFSGLHCNAGDFGKMMVNSKILPSPSHFDYIGSTKSLLERYNKLTGKFVDGFELIDKIKSLDEPAIEAYDDFLESLVTGLHNITYILDPEAIIIGGGISAQGNFFFDKVNKIFQKRIIGIQSKTVIIKAELENNAGLIGAAYICKNKNYNI